MRCRVVATGGYIGIYTPQNQSTLIFFVVVLSPCNDYIVNIYTHPNQIPGYATDALPDAIARNCIVLLAHASFTICGKLFGRWFCLPCIRFVSFHWR